MDVNVGGEMNEEVEQVVDNFFHVNHSNPEEEKEYHDTFDSFGQDPFFSGDVFGDGGGGVISDQYTCKRVLYQPLLPAASNVRLWDTLILLPNLAFLLFLAWRFRAARQKLRATNSPIFRAFYALVCVSSLVSVVRCAVSMTVSAATPTGDETDKLLWILLRLILLATEMSVVVFGLASGHLDSRRSIRRVVLVASLVSLAFSATQASLELFFPDPDFRVTYNGDGDGDSDSEKTTIELFGHGGMLFWLLSSAAFALVYLCVLLLPWLPCRHTLTLPHKRSFYVYVAGLLALNTLQALGSALVYAGAAAGLCLVDLTTYLYFTVFTPVVYYTFLRGFFKVAQPQLLFSYKAQVDDFDEEMPHSASLQFAVDANDQREMNTPIVLNSSTVFGENGGDAASAPVSAAADAPMPNNTGIASPDSVINYSFGGGAGGGGSL